MLSQKLFKLKILIINKFYVEKFARLNLFYRLKTIIELADLSSKFDFDHFFFEFYTLKC